MNVFNIRKKNGEIVEFEADEALTVAEIMEACGEAEEEKNPVLDQLVSLVATLKEQGGAKAPVVNVTTPKMEPPIVNVAAPIMPPAAAAVMSSMPSDMPKDWKRASLTITEWDKHGRVKSMNLEKIF
jgi:hypothetical protein